MTVRLALVCILAAALSWGQPLSPPKIGIIDYFGIKKASRERIEKALEVKPGAPMPKSKGELELQLELVNNVVRAELEAVCCEDGKAILYVGILEKGGKTFEFHEQPTDESVHLPEPLVDLWQQFVEQVNIAVREGKAAEDLTNGHSLMQYAPARDLQLQFPALVDANLPLLRDVLRKSADETERAIAAYMIPYATKKRGVIDDLQYAVRDPDDGVRNNAMRSLAALAVLGKLKPMMDIQTSPTWFVEQLNSMTFSDRNKAAFALVSMTEGRDPQTLGMLKDRALDSMIDMARFQHLPHALPGFIDAHMHAGLHQSPCDEGILCVTVAVFCDDAGVFLGQVEGLLGRAGSDHLDRPLVELVHHGHRARRVEPPAEPVQVVDQGQPIVEVPGIDGQMRIAQAAIHDRHAIDATPIAFGNGGSVVGSIDDHAIHGDRRRPCPRLRAASPRG